MGFRNPFRMSVDKPTGIVYLGDYGPDAGRRRLRTAGPAGRSSSTGSPRPATTAGRTAPAATRTTETYNEYTFPSGPSQAEVQLRRRADQQLVPQHRPADAARGQAGLDPVRRSTPTPRGVRRRLGVADGRPGLPVQRRAQLARSSSRSRWTAGTSPASTAAAGSRRSRSTATARTGRSPAFPWTGTQVMDMAFGPDGALYVLDYGTGANDQALYRIEYIGGGNRSPIAVASANPTSGPNPLTVNFSSAGSSDPEGGALTLPVDVRRRHHLDGGQPDEDVHHQRHLHRHAAGSPTRPGCPATASLVGHGRQHRADGEPHVARPTGSCSPSATRCRSTVTVSDPEDGTIDCSKVTVTYFAGPRQPRRTRSPRRPAAAARITVPADGEHDSAANIFGVFVAVVHRQRRADRAPASRTLQPQAPPG